MSTSSAAAQTSEPESCGFEHVILDLARKQLELLPQVRGFSQAYRARDPAYMLLRYDSLNYQQAADLFENIKSWDDRAARHISELETAYAISQLGTYEGLAINGQDPFDTFARGTRSVLRAVILSDGGQSFFNLHSIMKEPPEREHRADQGASLPRINSFLIHDQTDAFKLNFAQLAEAPGETFLAAHILANRNNLSEYDAFLDAMAGDQSLEFLPASEFSQDWHPLLRLQGIPFWPSYNQSPWSHGFLMWADIELAGLLSPETSFLFTFVIQSGEEEGSAKVARTFIDAIQTVGFSDTESAWLYIFNGLVNELGQEVVFETLSRFAMHGRHFADRILDTIDWAAAKYAITPYLVGETTQLPDRPKNISDNFEWESWISIAQQIRNANGSAITLSYDSETTMAAEMYYLLDDFDNIIAIVERDLSPKDAAAVFRDHMKRLDLRCAAYTDYPARAVFLGGGTLFRFPPATPENP